MRVSPFMPKFSLLLPTGTLVLFLASCGGTGSISSHFADHPSGTGPFDSRGNYIESWADDPSKWSARSVPKPSATPTSSSQRKQDPPPIVQSAPPPPVQTTYNPPAPTPKPKPKPQPKPQPKYTYHTVKKGDTLYGLAKRYGTTVSKIQQANALKGSIIRPNQKLKIPR